MGSRHYIRSSDTPFPENMRQPFNKGLTAYCFSSSPTFLDMLSQASPACLLTVLSCQKRMVIRLNCLCVPRQKLAAEFRRRIFTGEFSFGSTLAVGLSFCLLFSIC